MIARGLGGLVRLGVTLLWLGALSLAGPAFAQRDQPAPGYNKEYIDSYQTTITILPDGELMIRETLRVYVKRDQIERGIYRDFARAGLDAYQPSSPPIRNLYALRDGATENIARTEYVDGSYRAYFGREDVKLPKNRFYTWEINYRVPKAIRQYDETDNFDWNVMPHFWNFPVREWRVQVNYPSGAQPVDSKAFSGAFGASGNAYDVRVEPFDGGVVLTGAPLDANRGVTFVQRFTPDLLASGPNYPVLNEAYYANLRAQQEARRAQEEAERQRLRELAVLEVEANLTGLMALLTLAAALAGLTLLIWFMIGRESATMPVIVPQFYPPNFIGPAAARFLFRRGHASRERLLTTGLVSLAVKGSIRLERDRIERISARESNLTPAEIGILNDLNLQFTDSAFSLKKPSDNKAKLMTQAGKNLRKRFRDEFRQNFRPNWLWMIVLLVAVPVLWVAASLLTAFYAIAIFMLFIVVLFFMSLVLLRSGQTSFHFRSWVYFVLVLGGLGLGSSWIMAAEHPAFLTLYAAYGLSALGLFFARVHINNYSTAGAETAAELEGLRMYIRAAERGALKDEPEPDFKHFSDVYPYAFALGLHTEWAERFDRELKGWLEAHREDDSYLWYGSGIGSFHSTLDRFESNVSKNLNYSSSSSSGGSSFSGGGGGGGGGGGW